MRPFVGKIPVRTPQHLPAMSERRRRFLRQTLLGTAALFVAPVLDLRPLAAQAAPGAPRQLDFFSDREYALVSAAAARITGHAGNAGAGENPIDAALRADRFLSTEDPEIQDQIHLLLTIFGSPVAAFFFSFSFSGFLTMDAASQDDYIRGWMTSSLGFRRTGFQALKRLSMSMHYTDERSWEEIGYHGMELPGGTR
jgi:hypothetical protein